MMGDSGQTQYRVGEFVRYSQEEVSIEMTTKNAIVFGFGHRCIWKRSIHFPKIVNDWSQFLTPASPVLDFAVSSFEISVASTCQKAWKGDAVLHNILNLIGNTHRFPTPIPPNVSHSSLVGRSLHGAQTCVTALVWFSWTICTHFMESESKNAFIIFNIGVIYTGRYRPRRFQVESRNPSNVNQNSFRANETLALYWQKEKS